MTLSCGQFTRRQAIKVISLAGASTVSWFSSGARIKIIQSTQASNLRQHAPNAAVAAWRTLPPTPVLPKPARSELIALNGTRIFFAQFGEGPDVLLLHGGLANSDYWGFQIKELAQAFSITVMDTRGHGRSPLILSQLSYKVFAEDVASLLDFLNIPAVSIIGWSDGAITGLQLAMTQPDRVSRLLAFGANSSVHGLKRDTSQTGVFASFTERCKAEYRRLSPHPERWPQLLEGLRMMWRKEPRFTNQDLASLKPPITISDGDHDEIIEPSHTRRIANEIPSSRLIIQRNVSHFAMLQDPLQFNGIVRDFLR